MRPVAFVAPYLLEATQRFVEAAARLPGVRLGLVTTEPVERIPPGLRHLLAGHWRVDEALDPDQLTGAVEGLGGQIGRVERLLGILEQAQVPMAQVRERLGLPGLDVATALAFRDKAHMKDRLRAAGVPVARHRLCRSADEARAFAADVGFPLVVKPPAGAGARSTFRLDDAAALDGWLAAAAPAPHDPAQVEEFLSGEEHSWDSATVGGRVVWWSVSRYLPTPLEVLRQPWVQWVVLMPRDVSGPEYAPITDVGPAALRALGLPYGIAHMEWFRRPDGSVAVGEVGARPPGAQISTLLSYVHDFDLHAAWARLEVFGEFDPPPRRWAAGAAYLRGQGSGDRVATIHGLEELQRELGHLVVEAKLPRPGQAPTGEYTGEGYVIVRHPETEVVERALARIVTGLRVELGPGGGQQAVRP